MYKKIIIFLVLVLIGCKNQGNVTAGPQKNTSQQTESTQPAQPTKSTHTSHTRDAVYKQSKYSPSDLLLNVDFEEERVKAIKSKKGSQDVLTLKTPKGEAGAAAIMYEGGVRDNRYAEITKDPANNNNNVFHYWLKDARIEGMYKGQQKGRIQLNLVGESKTSVFQRYRLYLHPDLKFYQQYPKENSWFTINELWMGAQWEKHPYPYRLSLNIAKPAGVGKPLYFVVSSGVANGGNVKNSKWKDIWGVVGDNFEVPVGEWLDVELGYKQGNKQTGRFYLAVKRAKDKKFTTIFDVTDWTYHPDSPKPVALTHWQPLKIYTSSNIIDFVREKNGVVQIYWDDLEIYNNW